MKASKKVSSEMRSEYRREDIGKGVRGKYYAEYTKGTNLILLSPDVATAFPDEESVNSALRGLLHLARKSVGSRKPSRRKKPSTGVEV